MPNYMVKFGTNGNSRRVPEKAFSSSSVNKNLLEQIKNYVREETRSSVVGASYREDMAGGIVTLSTSGDKNMQFHVFAAD